MRRTVKRVLIIGCNGGFGELLRRRFAVEGLFVGGIDLQESASHGIPVDAYLRCDVTTLSDDAREYIRTFCWIVLCIPEAPAVNALHQIIEAARPGAMIADILSVKSAIVSAAEGTRSDCEYVSIHPLFAPDAGMRGNVAVIPVRFGSNTAQFLAMLRRWEGSLIEMTADEHDRAMTIVQVISHAAILALGATAVGSDVHVRDNTSTPVHAMLLSLVDRVTAGDPALYWDIQRTNPYAAAARDRLIDSLERLIGIIRDDRFDEFTGLFRDIRRMQEHR